MTDFEEKDDYIQKEDHQFVNSLVMKEKKIQDKILLEKEKLAEKSVNEREKEERALSWDLNTKIKELKKKYRKELKLDDSIKVLVRFKNQFLHDDVTLKEVGIKPNENKINIYLTKEDEEIFKSKILKNKKLKQ